MNGARTATAAAYGIEREVGQALRDSYVPRDDLFLETKAWISDYGYDETLPAFDWSAGRRGGPEPEDITLAGFGMADPRALSRIGLHPFVERAWVTPCRGTWSAPAGAVRGA